MARLNATQRKEVRRDVMREWSAQRLVMDVNMLKDELLTLIGFIDDAAEGSDTDVIGRIPGSHPANAWLIANQSIARRMKELVEKKRKEVL